MELPPVTFSLGADAGGFVTAMLRAEKTLDAVKFGGDKLASAMSAGFERMGRGAVSLADKMQQLGGTVSGVASHIPALMSGFGIAFGPLGAGIQVGITAIGALISAFGRAEQAADEAADRMAEAFALRFEKIRLKFETMREMEARAGLGDIGAGRQVAAQKEVDAAQAEIDALRSRKAGALATYNTAGGDLVERGAASKTLRETEPLLKEAEARLAKAAAKLAKVVEDNADTRTEAEREREAKEQAIDRKIEMANRARAQKSIELRDSFYEKTQQFYEQASKNQMALLLADQQAAEEAKVIAQQRELAELNLEAGRLQAREQADKDARDLELQAQERRMAAAEELQAKAEEAERQTEERWGGFFGGLINLATTLQRDGLDAALRKGLGRATGQDLSGASSESLLAVGVSAAGSALLSFGQQLLARSAEWKLITGGVDAALQKMADGIGKMLKPIYPLVTDFLIFADALGPLGEVVGQLLTPSMTSLFYVLKGVALLALGYEGAMLTAWNVALDGFAAIVALVNKDEADKIRKNKVDTAPIDKAIKDLWNSTFDVTKAQDDLTRSTQALNDQTRGLPSWYKGLAGAIYGAASPEGRSFSGSGVATGTGIASSPSGGGGRGGATYQIAGDLVITGVDSIDDATDRVEQEAGRKGIRRYGSSRAVSPRYAAAPGV